MAGIFIGAPAPIGLPPVYRPWTSLTHTWTGWTGDSWDITTRGSGVLLRSGARGMGAPDETHYWQDGVATDGSVWTGSITEKRQVFWPLSVFRNTGSLPWIEHDRRLWRTFHPRHTGVWSVTQPGTDEKPGETRRLTLRFVDDGGFAPDTDPVLVGWTQYGLNLVAEQPFWVGDPISRTFAAATTPKNFFGGATFIGSTPSQRGYGAPFFIASASSMARANIDNPGDEDGYLTWTVFGPCSSAVVGVDGHSIEIAQPLGAGEWLQIDTRPVAQTFLLGSGDPVDPSTAVEGIGWAGAVDFGRVAPGDNVPLSVSMSGTGRVQADLIPLYRRAW